MLGAIVGSVYESRNIKSMDFELFGERSRFTDYPVMTLTVAKCLTNDKYHSLARWEV